MNNEIKINNPLRTYNAPQKTSSVPTDTQQNISGIVDPQKATKINQKDLSDSRQNIFNALRESNFNKFALMVKNSPTLIEELKFMLLNKVDDMLAMFKDTELEFLLEKFNSSSRRSLNERRCGRRRTVWAVIGRCRSIVPHCF